MASESDSEIMDQASAKTESLFCGPAAAERQAATDGANNPKDEGDPTAMSSISPGTDSESAGDEEPSVTAIELHPKA